MRGSDLLNQIAQTKRSQAETVRFVLEKDEALGSRIASCGSWLHLREWLDHGGEMRLRNANFCKSFRLCKNCARRRALLLISAYLGIIQDVMQSAVILGNRPLIPAIVTTTVRNGPDLRERLLHIRDSSTKMTTASRRARCTKTRNAPNEWSKVAGAIRSTEIKLGRGGLWHPHQHWLVLLYDYMDHAKLCSEWFEYTGDSFVVGITQVRGNLDKALFEVIKYVVKFADLTPEQLWEVHLATQGTRAFVSFGCLFGHPEPDIDFDSCDGLSGPFRDWLARWLIRERKFDLQPYSVAEEVSDAAASVACPA